MKTFPFAVSVVGLEGFDRAATENSSVCRDEFYPFRRSVPQMAAFGPSTIVLSLGGPLARADVPALCERVRALLEATEADVVCCDVSGLLEANAVAVDALARLQLTARRLGRRMRLRHASDELGALLVFTGLAEACGLPGELERQAEEREHGLGVEEEGELDDAPA